MAEIPAILNFTRRLRLQYAGHVLRGSVPPATRATLTAPPISKRPRGGVRKRYYDQVSADARSLGAPDWKTAALNRDAWKGIQKILLDSPDPREDRRSAAKRRREDRALDQHQQAQHQQDQQDDLGDP